ncbi:scf e3 ubiquitin ligase complex f-box protein grra [Moniliophthora roreri MCA 2997]|uniref:Scf e3 ubiquitin ligase complex f-box protein grra n=1 Tax=Moniliophthora roreri (strain MCA 2997) TaxID=1381753 RepID=V2Y0X9_MONRO|nr:scf e3 ubiquitin ligase complex f-box protein grra [Moniliophthora roreri MCA 2997]
MTSKSKPRKSQGTEKSQPSSSTTTARKRQRTEKSLPAFGAPSTADDQPSLRYNPNDPSSSASSSRTPPVKTIPSLSTLCARCFAAYFVKIRGDEKCWARTSQHLRLVPDVIIPKLFGMLAASHPTFLSHETIVTYFFRGPTLTLNANVLPGVNRNTILSVPRLNSTVRDLELSGFSKMVDDVFASIFTRLRELRTINLRGCTKVGAKTVEAIAKSCPHLRVINLNYTSAPPLPIATLINSCSELEVLKLAGIKSWTDATFSKLAKAIDENARFISMRTLKLRLLGLTDHSLNFLISLFPNLKRLDLSFTLLKRPSILLSEDSPALEKLVLTSTELSAADLLSMVARLPNLKTLSLGALGIQESSKAAINNSSAMTMTDASLRSLTDIITRFENLKSVNLAANTKLGTTTKVNGALAYFVRHVGRRCKYLNLSGIYSLRSDDLSGLLRIEDNNSPPVVERLLLNHTRIDDEASPYLGSCHNLITLEVAGTKLTSEGLFPILDGCPQLEHLELTSCRGVPVLDRRQFFDVWENQKNAEV